MNKKKEKLIFTKSDLITALSKKHKTTKIMATIIVNSVLNSISDTLKKGDRAEIRGLGTFELREYKSYEGRNPQTSETITVAAKKRPFFKPGKFKEKINDSRKNN